jgi:hypothetical protein
MTDRRDVIEAMARALRERVIFNCIEPCNLEPCPCSEASAAAALDVAIAHGYGQDTVLRDALAGALEAEADWEYRISEDLDIEVDGPSDATAKIGAIIGDLTARLAASESARDEAREVAHYATGTAELALEQCAAAEHRRDEMQSVLTEYATDIGAKYDIICDLTARLAASEAALDKALGCNGECLTYKLLQDRLAASESARERMRVALEGLATVMQHCSFMDGICCCGEDMARHSTDCGHTPVDHGSYHAKKLFEVVRAVLAETQETTA